MITYFARVEFYRGEGGDYTVTYLFGFSLCIEVAFGERSVQTSYQLCCLWQFVKAIVRVNLKEIYSEHVCRVNYKTQYLVYLNEQSLEIQFLL